MSLFTEPVDRFFVGKLFFGLLFVGSVFKLLAAVTTPLLRTRAFDGEAVLLHGLGCLLGYGAFRFVETRRRTVPQRCSLG